LGFHDSALIRTNSYALAVTTLLALDRFRSSFDPPRALFSPRFLMDARDLHQTRTDARVIAFVPCTHPLLFNPALNPKA
jgi:hypothetical protein